MEIMVGDYKIVSDTNQFVVYHVTKSGEKAKVPGSQVDNFVGNYSDFKTALKALPNRMLMRSNVSSLREAIDMIDRYRVLIDEATKGMEKSFGGLMNVSKQVGTAFTGIGLAITGALGVAVKNFADAGSAALEMSQKTGLSTEAVGKWGFALEMSGASSETLGKAMTGMAKSMDQANQQQLKQAGLNL